MGLGSAKPVANCEKLPIASDSIDSIVLYHALDFTNDCHELLREATRILRPGGNMLVIGLIHSAFGAYGGCLNEKKRPHGKGDFFQ